MKPIRLEELRDSALLLAQEPPKIARGVLYGFVGLMAALLVWSYFVRVPTIVRAEGMIRPAGRIRIVDAEVGGRVIEAPAQEHQQVKEGDLLLRLDAEQRTLDLKRIERELSDLRPEEADLKVMAERLAAWKPGVPVELEGLARYRERFAAWVRGLELDEVTVQRRRDAHGRLKRLGGSAPEAELKKARLALQEAESTQRLTLAKRRAEVEGDLETARRSIEEQEFRREQTQNQLDRLEVRAPVSGTITFVAVRNPGEVVTVGQKLYHIAREGEGFIAEVWVPTQEAGFVEVEMEARVEVPTFPESSFGWIAGRVRSVAADIPVAHEGAAAVTLYRVELALEKDHLVARDGRVGRLRLGLQTRARLVVREERLLFRLTGQLRELFRLGM